MGHGFEMKGGSWFDGWAYTATAIVAGLGCTGLEYRWKRMAARTSGAFSGEKSQRIIYGCFTMGSRVQVMSFSLL